MLKFNIRFRKNVRNVTSVDAREDAVDEEAADEDLLMNVMTKGTQRDDPNVTADNLMHFVAIFRGVVNIKF